MFDGTFSILLIDSLGIIVALYEAATQLFVSSCILLFIFLHDPIEYSIFINRLTAINLIVLSVRNRDRNDEKFYAENLENVLV